MNYLKYFNNQLSDIFDKNQNVYVYGQNVATGSHLSGLTRNLKLTNNYNNCPNTWMSSYIISKNIIHFLLNLRIIST